MTTMALARGVGLAGVAQEADGKLRDTLSTRFVVDERRVCDLVGLEGGSPSPAAAAGAAQMMAYQVDETFDLCLATTSCACRR
jgi:hypothetical protein